jgi:type IV secretory pathway TrbF-like protein
MNDMRASDNTSAQVQTDPQFNAAKQLYAEQYGDAIVSNWHWKLGFLAMSIIAVGLLYFNLSTIAVLRDFKPIFVRVDAVGRAEVAKYDDLTYRPEAHTIRYFLSDFVRTYYGRNRYLIEQNFEKSLRFLDNELARSVRNAWEKNDVIQEFLRNSDHADIEIEVNQVALEQLSDPPFKASVDFDQVFYNPVDRSERARDSYTANFIFVFRDHIPKDTLLVNPIGLAITYFREDRAFDPERVSLR